ncbi:hypothetical protein Tco_1211390 [Tanacetum coccineum]
MGFKASSSWFLASKGFVLSSTSARAWIGFRIKVEKSCEDEMKGYKGSLKWWKKEKRAWLPKVMMRYVYNLVAKVDDGSAWVAAW